MIVAAGSPARALQFTTGAVALYTNNGGAGPDLPDTIPEAQDFAAWLIVGGGHTLAHAWTNGNVFGSDFREGTDLDPNGASDAVDLYYFTGHGSCENPPTPTSGDFIIVHGNSGQPDTTNIGKSSRWGNKPGRARFILLDASCPMDLVSLKQDWFPTFRGLHIATGHSGDINHDTQDSVGRGNDFGFALVPNNTLASESVGGAWLDTGLEDVDDGVCAVVIASGSTRNDAIDRRDNERIRDNRPAPTPHWVAWRWRCDG